MRVAFTRVLLELAEKDKNIMLLTGDLGYSVFEPFIEQFPKQFINMGVAEQNMTGVAAGLAMEGKIPFIYSIIPFVTMRNYEQIRNDICYQNLNVKIVGVGAGFSYGPYGHTHHALEDIGLMRGLENMVVTAPGDPKETEQIVKQSITISNPMYIRLGKAGEPNVYEKSEPLKIGKGVEIAKGKDVTLVATSNMLFTASNVVKELQKREIHTGLISMHTIKPLDEKLIIEIANKTKLMISLEEHSVINGLGSAIAEVLAEHSTAVHFKRIGVPDRITKAMGMHDFMRRANNLDDDQITEYIVNTFQKMK